MNECYLDMTVKFVSFLDRHTDKKMNLDELREELDFWGKYLMETRSILLGGNPGKLFILLSNTENFVCLCICVFVHYLLRNYSTDFDLHGVNRSVFAQLRAYGGFH